MPPMRDSVQNFAAEFPALLDRVVGTGQGLQPVQKLGYRMEDVFLPRLHILDVARAVPGLQQLPSLDSLMTSKSVDGLSELA